MPEKETDPQQSTKVSRSEHTCDVRLMRTTNQISNVRKLAINYQIASISLNIPSAVKKTSVSGAVGVSTSLVVLPSWPSPAIKQGGASICPGAGGASICPQAKALVARAKVSAIPVSKFFTFF